MSDAYTHDGRPGYEFEIVSSVGDATVVLDAKTVEEAVAAAVVINPVLDGPNLWLQFHDRGGGFEEQDENRYGADLAELIDCFLEQSEFKSEPAEFRDALLALDFVLLEAHRKVFAKAQAIGAVPDPLGPEFMPDLAQKLRDLGI